MKIYKNNKLKIKHIYFDKSKQRFRISLVDTYTGKSKHHGTFKTVEEAKLKLNQIKNEITP